MTYVFLLNPLICLLALSLQTQTITQYCNPLDLLLADPYALYHEGTYYLYATSFPWEGYGVWTSRDLANWRYRGKAFTKTPTSWGKYNFWAPEVVHKDGTFYMFYSAHGESTSLRVCLATSDSPLGPFTDAKAPYFDFGQAYIDAHCFFDDDGTPYFYFVKDMSESPTSEIWSCQLSDDLMNMLGEPQFCVAPEGGWEGSQWTEGPFVLKHEGTYYMMYSASGYFSNEYSVGYATSDSPLGPWTKHSGNPILTKTDKVSGPGHNSVVQSPDGSELYAVYHTHQSFAGGGSRQLAIDRLYFVDNPEGPDLMKIAGPTISPQPLPSGALPIPCATSDDFSDPIASRDQWFVFNESVARRTIVDSTVEIEMEKGSVSETSADLKNLFLQYAPEGDFEISIKVQMDSRHYLDHAFLMIWGDHNNYIHFSKTYATMDYVAIVVENDGVYNTDIFQVPFADVFYLKISKTSDLYKFYYSTEDSEWEEMPKGIERPFQQIKVGFGAASPMAGSLQKAGISEFTISTPSPANSWSVY